MSKRMKRTKDKFPEALEKKIEEKGYTRESFAKAMDVSQQAVSAWIKGGNINSKNREKIEKLLNLQLVVTVDLDTEDKAAIEDKVPQQLEMRWDEPPEEDAGDKWIKFYKTIKPGVYTAVKGDTKFILVKQLYEDLREDNPYVMLAVPKKHKKEAAE